MATLKRSLPMGLAGKLLVTFTAILGTTALLAGAACSLWTFDHYRVVAPPLRVVLGGGALVLAALAMGSRSVSRVFACRITAKGVAMAFPVLWLACWLLRERHHVGDWLNPYVYAMDPLFPLRNMSYLGAPLAYFMQYIHARIATAVGAVDLLQPWQVILSGWGALYLCGSLLFFKEALGGRRAIAGWLVLVTGGLFFFATGRVETYAMPMSFVALTAWLSMKGLKGDKPSLIAAHLSFGAMLMSHPQCFIFFPSLTLTLWEAGLRGRRCLAMNILTLVAVPIAVQILAMLATPDGIGQSRDAVQTALIPVAEAFSAARLPVIGGILWLSLPMLAGAVVAVLAGRNALRSFPPRDLWLAHNAAAGFCFVLFAWNKAPLSRDWDFMGPSLLMIAFAAVTFSMRTVPSGVRLRVFLATAALQAPHAILWWSYLHTPQPLDIEAKRYMQTATDLLRSGVPRDALAARLDALGLRPPVFPIDGP